MQKKNKRVENRKTDLCQSSKQFEAYIQDNIDPSFTWKVNMFPKIKEVVIETLRSVQENIKHKNNYFELYGFDFVLDQELNPWLIEVNLSPACSQRTDYLKEMLGSMADGILDHIETRISLMNRKIEQISKPSHVLPFPKVTNIDASYVEEDEELQKQLKEPETSDVWILVLFERNKLHTYSQNMAK